jgi:hypothetical protein
MAPVCLFKATRIIFQRTFRLAGAKPAGGANHRHTIPFQYGNIKFFGVGCRGTELLPRQTLLRAHLEHCYGLGPSDSLLTLLVRWADGFPSPEFVKPPPIEPTPALAVNEKVQIVRTDTNGAYGQRGLTLKRLEKARRSRKSRSCRPTEIRRPL